MNLDTKMKYLLVIEVLVVVALMAMVVFLPETDVSRLRLWEIFPAVIAAMITTFGLKEMKEKT